MKTNRGWVRSSILLTAVTGALACSAEGINELVDRGSPVGAATGGAAGASGVAATGGGAAGGATVAGSAGLAAGGSGGNPGSAGSSGAAAGGGGTGSATAVCATPVAAAAGVLLNFDDGRVQAAGKGLYVYADSTTLPAGAFTPLGSSPAAGVQEAGASGKDFHFTGAGFPAAAWGGGVGIWLNCSDVTELTGVRFQLKSDVKVRFSVMTAANTAHPEGTCTGDYKSCVNGYKVLSPTGDYTEQSVDFSMLAGQKPSAFDAAQVVGVQFIIEKSGTEVDGWGWDVAIDEIELY